MKDLKKQVNNVQGFTLMEILIVVIIIGVLAGLAAPVYRKTVEKTRKVEALGILNAVRQAELRYYAASNKYTGTFTELDYNPTDTADASGQTVHFTYGVGNVAATTFTATATRNGNDAGDGTSTVTLNQAGAVGGTGAFS